MTPPPFRGHGDTTRWARPRVTPDPAYCRPTRHWLIKFPASPTSDDCCVLSQPRLIREAVRTGLKDRRGSYPARQERCQWLPPRDVSVHQSNTILWRCICIDLERSLRRRDHSLLPIISKDRKGTQCVFQQSSTC